MPKPVTPLLTVDCVAFNAKGRVILIQRKHPPFKGGYALPGGFVDVGETVEAACKRELQEETGVVAKKLYFIGVYSDPDRDPRGHTVSVVYATLLSRVRPKAGDDAATARWVANWHRKNLAFDHETILQDAYRSMRRRRLIPPIK